MYHILKSVLHPCRILKQMKCVGDANRVNRSRQIWFIIKIFFYLYNINSPPPKQLQFLTKTWTTFPLPWDNATCSNIRENCIVLKNFNFKHVLCIPNILNLYALYWYNNELKQYNYAITLRLSKNLFG